jgi:hypothetical protein
LGDYRKEVGVITPARNDVLVKVLGYTRPSQLPLVHAQVETLSPGYFSKYLHPAFTQSGHLRGLLKGCFLIGRHVTIGAHQQVTGIVGKKIQEYEAGFASENNQSILV